MKFWANLLGYQLTWFVLVIGAARGYIWPGMLCAIVFITSQWLTSQRRALEARLLLAAFLFAMIVDGIGARLDLLRHATPLPAILAAPWWIVALWLSFAMTINGSLRYLSERRFMAMALGAVGAPLAYAGAARGWQAVQFVPPAWHAWLWLSLGWTVAMAALTYVARHPNAMEAT